MNQYKRRIFSGAVCTGLALAAYCAWRFPFFEWETDNFDPETVEIFSLAYLRSLAPLLLIIALSAAGILLSLAARRFLLKKDKALAISARAGRGKGQQARPARSFSAFMAVRWGIMILSAAGLIFGGTLFSDVFSGLFPEGISIPVLSCPVSSGEAGSGCYYLTHLDELFTLPLKTVLLFLGSLLASAVLLGRTICGFLCPVGLVQDIVDRIRRRSRAAGVTMTDRMYRALVPVRWMLVFLFLGLVFAGGNFCNFCPAAAVTPILAGLTTSLYLSGYLMVLVLIGGFFKRRLWCNVCPLGYLLGLFHRISPFRIRKDCDACTECGACYEACPMGIRAVYTEREQTDVTDSTCIFCGECIRNCPENNALAMTLAGVPLYRASRRQIMAGYGQDAEENAYDQP